MSKKRRKSPKLLSEQKTLPIQDTGVRSQDGGKCGPSCDANVKRTKNWGEDHQC